MPAASSSSRPARARSRWKLGVAPGQGVELAFQLIEPLAQAARPVVGLAKVIEPPGGLGVASGLVEHGAARLGLDLGDLPRWAGKLAQPRSVRRQRAVES